MLWLAAGQNLAVTNFDAPQGTAPLMHLKALHRCVLACHQSFGWYLDHMILYYHNILLHMLQEFNIEKLQLLEAEKAKIRKDYERREGQIDVKKKM